MAPFPQAMVKSSSMTEPAAPLPSVTSQSSTLMRVSLTGNQALGRATVRECGCGRPPPAARSRYGPRPCRSCAHRSRPHRAAARSGSPVPPAPRHQPCAKSGQGVVQGLRRGLWRDRQPAHLAHGSGVEALRHAHDGDARPGVAGHDGALDGCRAAPARQERGMDIEASSRGASRNGLGQEQAIGHTTAASAASAAKRRCSLGRPEGHGRANLDAMRGGKGVYG